MANQPRVAKVLALLIVSMTLGAIVLLALGNHPLPAGPFSLASYFHLDSIQQVVASRAPTSADRWNCIEIFYSKTAGGNLEQLASLRGLASPEDLNFHFLICNGRSGPDGQIQVSEKWQRQWSCLPGRTWYGSSRTVRMCLIADGKDIPPTDCQIKRAAALVEVLSRKFNIRPEHIYYPGNSQL